METGTSNPQAASLIDNADAKLDDLLNRINGLSQSSVESSTASSATTAPPLKPSSKLEVPTDNAGKTDFLPEAPTSLRQAGLSEAMMEELICKYLLAKGEASIRDICDQVAMPFNLVEQVVTALKAEQVLGYIGQAAMNDYICKLSELGRARARRYSDSCTYFGAAPVAFQDYVDSVAAQTINNQNPTQEDLRRAFSDLLIDPAMMIKLGPAVNSGKGMFLFGYPGNGKTSIAERITAAFGPYVWIPRAIGIDRDIIRVFDSMNHEEAPLEQGEWPADRTRNSIDAGCESNAPRSSSAAN